MSTNNEKGAIRTEGDEPKTISVKLRVDAMTNVMIKDANLLIVALPINSPRFTALGFLWSVLSEMTTFYDALELQAKQKASGGIVRATAKDAMALGAKLLGK